MRNAAMALLMTVGSGLLNTSCSDFLKEVSQDEFEPKTTKAYQELMNGEGYIGNCTDPITFMIDDDVDGCRSVYWTSIIRTRLNLFQWQPNYWRLEDEESGILESITGSYRNIYKTIAACNIIIENTPGSEGPDKEKNIVLGEAKTMRAFYYWKLVNTYAMPYNDQLTQASENLGVPVVIESEVKDGGVKRNTVAEVYAQIVKDIEEACAHFGDDRTNRGKYRAGFTAAHLMASRIYLFMENWEKVIEHANLALEEAPALCDLRTYRLNTANNGNNGVISVNFPETIFIGGMKAMTGEYSLTGTPYHAAEGLVDTYATLDCRRNIYIQDAPYDYKYRICKICADEHEFTWRTAELYLNRAEAELELYKKNGSMGEDFISDMTALMTTRYHFFTAPTLSQTTEELQELLRSERRKEMCFEGLRFFDLKRYGMPSIIHTQVNESGTKSIYRLEERDPFYCVPLPDEALDHNELLQQNKLPEHRVAS